MSRIVRSSKYRHVFGEPAKKENTWDELRVTKSATESNLVAASATMWAVLWESGGGGSFAVGQHHKPGKWDPNAPVVSGHKGTVLDLDFSPFNDGMVASVSEDGYAKVWIIPDGGLTATMTDAAQTLKGHKRKATQVKFNTIANNVLATTSADLSVKVWDVERGESVISVDAQHSDLIQSLDWSFAGQLVCTTCKDKKLRVVDPRQNKVAAEGEGHAGVKGSRAIFLGRSDRIFSVGFSKGSEREFAIWDVKDLSKPLVRQSIDSGSGLIMPFFDTDNSILYLTGKGDGNIRYYEIVDEAPFAHQLSEFKSSTPARGIAWVPKRAVSVSDCEIDRALKLATKTLEPIAFVVPRKSDIFQDDLYPDCFSGDPTLGAGEWFGGKNGDPKLRKMEGGFVKKDRPADFNPVVKEEKELSPDELKREVERLTARVNYLEAELTKRDAKIKELSQ